MANRSMAAKMSKAASQRGEYAAQALYKELAATPRDLMMYKGKLVPRHHAPVSLETLKAEHAHKLEAQRALRLALLQSLGKKTRFAWQM